MRKLFLFPALITLGIGLIGCSGPKEPLDEAFVFSNLDGVTEISVTKLPLNPQSRSQWWDRAEDSLRVGISLGHAREVQKDQVGKNIITLRFDGKWRNFSVIDDDKDSPSDWSSYDAMKYRVDSALEEDTALATRNPTIAVLDSGAKVSLVDSISSEGEVFYQIDLGNGERGWINRINIFADRQGVVPYEHESVDAIIPRFDNFSHTVHNRVGFDICHLVDAAFASDQKDFRSKGEFETTQEYEQKVKEYKEQRKYHRDLTRGITFVKKYKSLSGSYDADTEIMSLRTNTNYSSCRLPEPKRYNYWNGGYSKEVSYVYPYLRSWPSSGVGFDIDKLTIPRDVARTLDVEKMVILWGTKVNNEYKHYWKSESNMTTYQKAEGLTEYYMSLSGDTSFYVIARPDKTLSNAYFSDEYKKTWIRDLKIQLISFGYDAGHVVNSIDDQLQVALNQAKEDGLVTKSEPAIERVMELLLEERPASSSGDWCYPENWALLANPKRQQQIEFSQKTGKRLECVERKEYSGWRPEGPLYQ
ncbi:hypothetical protein OAT92_05025 [Porticoccaceae bacterium]|nr:hypothetical protein [Porticoccaceae bacterium]